MTRMKNNAVVCVDSSIFLAEIFENKTYISRTGIIDEFQKIFLFERYMSKTVDREIRERTARVIQFIEHTYSVFIKELIASKTETQNIDLDDLKFIESFFSKQKLGHGAGSTELDIIGNLEAALVWLLTERYRDKQRLKKQDLISLAGKEFNKIISKIKINFNTASNKYVRFDAPINPATWEKLLDEPSLEKTVRKKPNDIKILCEVEAYQQSSRKICLLITTDHADFLNNKSIIESSIGVKCIDPLYLPRELRQVD